MRDSSIINVEQQFETIVLARELPRRAHRVAGEADVRSSRLVHSRKENSIPCAPGSICWEMSHLTAEYKDPGRSLATESGGASKKSWCQSIDRWRRLSSSV